MILMINAASIFVIASACHAIAILVLAWAWLKKRPRWWAIGKRLVLAAAVVTVAGLVWHGIQTAAFPKPLNGIGWGLAGLAIWLWIESNQPPSRGLLVFGAGLLWIPVGWNVGRLLAAPMPASTAAQSLWRTGMHWLIAAGLAGLYWLTIIALATWAVRLFGQKSGLTRRLAAETEAYLPLVDRLHRLGAGLLLPGIAGLMAINGWQGYAIAPQTGPWAALLLLLAALWWLRRAAPKHQLLIEAMTVASFGGILPATMYLL